MYPSKSTFQHKIHHNWPTKPGLIFWASWSGCLLNGAWITWGLHGHFVHHCMKAGCGGSGLLRSACKQCSEMALSRILCCLISRNTIQKLCVVCCVHWWVFNLCTERLKAVWRRKNLPLTFSSPPLCCWSSEWITKCLCLCLSVSDYYRWEFLLPEKTPKQLNIDLYLETWWWLKSYFQTLSSPNLYSFFTVSVNRFIGT